MPNSDAAVPAKRGKGALEAKKASNRRLTVDIQYRRLWGKKQILESLDDPRLGGAQNYLVWLAKEKPQTYAGLLSTALKPEPGETGDLSILGEDKLKGLVERINDVRREVGKPELHVQPVVDAEAEVVE